MLRIATNKNRHFFGHSLGKGNPVVLVMALALLCGVSILPYPVLAGHCPDGWGGYPDALHTLSGGCLGENGGADVHGGEFYRNGSPGDTEHVYGTGSNEFDPFEGSGNDSGSISTVFGLINRINLILNIIVPFLIGLAVFLILYGIFGYITHSADEEKRAEAKKFILWSVIFVFLMLSVWGLINILSNSFRLDKTPPKVDSLFPSIN